MGWRFPHRQDGAEVGVLSKDDSWFTRRRVEDRAVVCLRQITIADVNGIMSRLTQSQRQSRRKTVVHQESHHATRRGNCRSRTASAA